MCIHVRCYVVVFFQLLPRVVNAFHVVFELHQMALSISFATTICVYHTVDTSMLLSAICIDTKTASNSFSATQWCTVANRRCNTFWNIVLYGNSALAYTFLFDGVL